jgi:hypothetical protein
MLKKLVWSSVHKWMEKKACEHKQRCSVEAIRRPTRFGNARIKTIIRPYLCVLGDAARFSIKLRGINGKTVDPIVNEEF